MNGGRNSPTMKLLLFVHIFNLFSFVHSILEVIGQLNGVVVLPCSFSPGMHEVIHWTNADNEKQKFHSYYDGKDMLDHQDSNFKGRTALFLDQIRNGNASLQIQKLEKSDEYKYSCYVSTRKERTQNTVILKVEVWGEKHKDVTIPCSFNPGEEVVIHWKITSNKSRTIHSYYQGQDMLDGQDKSYKGRTSLIPSELAKGNASLLIRDVQESDENTYSCYVGTKAESKVKLNVADFGHLIEYALDHDKPHLKCYISHVYPSDTVTIEWYEDNQKKQQNLNSSSSCTFCNIAKNSHTYKCVVRHSLVQNTWTGMWQTAAAAQDNIECACRGCASERAEISVRLYLQQNITKVPVASVNRSSLVIHHGYTSRVQGEQGNYSLHFNNLTDNDNGEYICETRMSDRMYIVRTFVNITDQKENLKRAYRWIPLISIGIVFITTVWVVSKVRNKDSQAARIAVLQHPLPELCS